MSTARERVLARERERGKQDAQALQSGAATMTGTQLYAAKDRIPTFAAACARKNMSERAAGFVCRSTAGRVVRLLQGYDSSIYQQEPEELPAQWGYVWSTDPAEALPFAALSTAPYMTGDCCEHDGQIWRSVIDNNVWSPADYPAGWAICEGVKSDE